MPRNQRPLRYSQQYQSNPNFTRGKYAYVKFGGHYPINLQNGTSAAPVSVPTLPTAVQDNVGTLTFMPDISIEQYSTTAQTLAPLVHATKGMEIALDQVNNESVEYVPGGNRVTSPFAFVVGTDSNFFFRATFEVTTAAGLDQFLLGFRKVQAYAVPASFLTGGAASYTDFAGVGFAATVATPNPINTSTSVGGAVNVVTPLNFTIPNGGIFSLGVYVVGGKAQYYINGVRSGNTISRDGSGLLYGTGAAITAQSTVTGAAYTFTSGLTVEPFLFLRQDAALSPVFIKDLEVGHLVDIGADPNQE